MVFCHHCGKEIEPNTQVVSIHLSGGRDSVRFHIDCFTQVAGQELYNKVEEVADLKNQNPLFNGGDLLWTSTPIVLRNLTPTPDQILKALDIEE